MRNKKRTVYLLSHTGNKWMIGIGRWQDHFPAFPWCLACREEEHCLLWRIKSGHRLLRMQDVGPRITLSERQGTILHWSLNTLHRVYNIQSLCLVYILFAGERGSKGGEKREREYMIYSQIPTVAKPKLKAGSQVPHGWDVGIFIPRTNGTWPQMTLIIIHRDGKMTVIWREGKQHLWSMTLFFSG